MKKTILIFLAALCALFSAALSFAAITLNYSNFYYGTLTADVSNAASTLSVTPGTNAGSPPNGNFRATIYSSSCSNVSSCSSREIVTLSLVSGQTFSVLERAAEGTSTPATWPSGSKVAMNITAGGLQEIIANIYPATAVHNSDASLASSVTGTPLAILAFDSNGNLVAATEIIQSSPTVTTPTAACDDGVLYRYPSGTAGNKLYTCESGTLERQGTQQLTKCTVIKGPTASDDYPIEKFPYAVTIRSIRVYTVGGTNVVGGLDECTGTAGVCSTSTAVDSDITGTADTNVADDGSLTHPGIAAYNWIRWHTTSVSGSPASVSICFAYTID